jgi:hypothetical protein
VLRIAVAVLVLQLSGCATTRTITRGTGSAIGALGALSMMFALSPLCDTEEECEAECAEQLDEEELQARGILLASGGAAVLVGGGLVAVSSVPKKKRRLSAQVVAPPPQNARPPATQSGQAMRELIEQRCIPEGGLDLRVPLQNGKPRAPLPPCS